jgi:biopolymer transport protein ExbD
MRRRVVPHPAPITRVNVTPIIDVALVLVIILMVTAPLMSVADLPVDLPAARTREAEHERNVSITLATDGRIAIDDEIVPPGMLRSRLAERLARPGDENVLVVVRADTHARHVEVRHLLDEARAAGAKRLAIGTRQTMNASPESSPETQP